METAGSIGLLTLAGAAGLYLIHTVELRSAKDVLLDLDNLSISPEEGHEDKARTYERQGREKCTVPLSSEKARSVIFPLFFASSSILVLWIIKGALTVGSLAAGLLVFGTCVLYRSTRERRAKEERIREIEFFLPVLMERLVMAVQAGLDIIPAIDSIIESEVSLSKPEDPVSGLLRRVIRLTESGLSFSEALNTVAQSVDSSPLRHAFIHLGVAYEEGGELITPLRELSDATQLYFQESIEEEIAKMPVRATMPLLCTFAGLLVFFLASPLVQIIDFVTKAKSGM
jgi:pilus assembly protein TadC